jgi:hypothetical protein
MVAAGNKTTATGSKIRFLNILAYIAVVAVGITLALAWLFGQMNVGDASLIGALKTIAAYLSYLVIACYSFFFARSKGIWWIVAWVASVTLIVISTII